MEPGVVLEQEPKYNQTVNVDEIVKIYINCSVALFHIAEILLQTFYDSLVLQVVAYIMTDTSN